MPHVGEIALSVNSVCLLVCTWKMERHGAAVGIMAIYRDCARTKVEKTEAEGLLPSSNPIIHEMDAAINGENVRVRTSE